MDFSKEYSDAGVPPKSENEMGADDKWLLEDGPCPGCGTDEDYKTDDFIYSITSCPNCHYTSVR